MTPEQRDKLVKFVGEIDQSSSKRQLFVNGPYEAIRSALELPDTDNPIDIGLANEVLAAVLRDASLTASLKDISSQYQSNAIDLAQTKKRAATVMAEKLPVDLKSKLNKTWLNDPAAISGTTDIGIANLLAAVDQVVLIDQAAVIHGTYFFSGAGISNEYDLKKLTDAFAGGQ